MLKTLAFFALVFTSYKNLGFAQDCSLNNVAPKSANELDLNIDPINTKHKLFLSKAFDQKPNLFFKILNSRIEIEKEGTESMASLYVNAFRIYISNCKGDFISCSSDFRKNVTISPKDLAPAINQISDDVAHCNLHRYVIAKVFLKDVPEDKLQPEMLPLLFKSGLYNKAISSQKNSEISDVNLYIMAMANAGLVDRLISFEEKNKGVAEKSKNHLLLQFGKAIALKKRKKYSEGLSILATLNAEYKGAPLKPWILFEISVIEKLAGKTKESERYFKKSIATKGASDNLFDIYSLIWSTQLNQPIGLEKRLRLALNDVDLYDLFWFCKEYLRPLENNDLLEAQRLCRQMTSEDLLIKK